tara:strand:- start:1260 stop:1562 length:303 start_codon:yes stop_codon:yes gene_type:complete
MKELSIYKITDNYENEECELVLGTLSEVHSGYKLWLEEHLSQDFDEADVSMTESWKCLAKYYPKAKLFYDNPEEWINKYGDCDAEIYFGWKLTHIYTYKN